MKLKRILSAFLVGVMLAASFTGCGEKQDDSAKKEETETPDTEEKEETKEPETSEEPYVVKIIAYGDATTESSQAVSEALSEITRDLYNIEVEVVKGYTVDQLNLMLTSGEKVDLVPILPWETSLATLAANDQILVLDELLKEYGSEMYEAIPEANWKCTTVAGQIYGVPLNNDNAQSYNLQMRKDIIDQLEIDYENIKTLDDVYEVLKKVKENTDLYPLGSTGGSNDLQFLFDGCGNNFGVLEDISTGDTTFVNLFETEAYKEYVTTMYKWNQEGLIMPDASSNTTIGSVNLAGNVFSFFSVAKPGVDVQASSEAGIEIVGAEIYPAKSVTSHCNDAYAIAAGTENPEAAMQVLNLLYTNAEASNLLANGIEGTHYVYVDEDKKFIAFPEGEDANSVGFTVNTWACPNEGITPLREGSEADLRDQMADFNSNAINSPAKGFVFETANVMNELTACNNVVAKYKNGLELGELNPEETLPKFNEELKAAGLETIIAEKQKQLDAWLAEQ